ncbi:hypothetical protein ANANG_G00297240 [Anguilla anguilla]|uniref:Uncharacterized protein n=1 Tax=Anguilla anguilla TaxID=7936 RepID=A0A9D3LMK4_ANGAN|nr:hypothetical protein ANANG_G00297240 [Anguilla anguilla]
MAVRRCLADLPPELFLQQPDAHDDRREPDPASARATAPIPPLKNQPQRSYSASSARGETLHSTHTRLNPPALPCSSSRGQPVSATPGPAPPLCSLLPRRANPAPVI